MANTAGVVSRRVLQTAWGQDLPGFTPLLTTQDRHGFTLRERDDESGLMHFRARSYDPRLGRFVQKDPILENRTRVHFIYGSNSPLNYIDPDGLQSKEEIGAVGKQVYEFLMKQDANWINNRGGFTKAFEKVVYEEIGKRGWLEKSGRVYTNVVLGQLDDGTKIVRKIGAGDGKLARSVEHGTFKFLQEESDQFDVVIVKAGEKIEIGKPWNANVAEAWGDAFGGLEKNIPAKKGTASMGRKASTMGGKKGFLISRIGLASFMGAMIGGMAFGAAEVDGPGFQQFVDGVKKENPRDVKAGGAKFYQHLAANGMKETALMWLDFYKHAEDVIRLSQADKLNYEK